MFIIVAIMGLVRPSDLGVRGALVATIMPPDRLVGAISLSRTTMDTARIAGALSGAGLLASLGIGPAYVAIFSLYIVGTLLTLCVVAPSTPHPADATVDGLLRRSPMRDLRAGVAYVWTTPRMRAAVWIAFLANLTAYPFSNGLLPYIARDIYGTNQTGLGYLSASFAVGSLAGSVALSLIGGLRVARLMIGATVTWYAALLVFVHMQTVPAAIACLMLAGFSQSLTMITIAVILMRTASEHFRGRVMGVRMLAIYSLPLGLLAAGSLIDAIGFVATGTLYVSAGLALLLAIALHWRTDLWHVARAGQCQMNSRPRGFAFGEPRSTSLENAIDSTHKNPAAEECHVKNRPGGFSPPGRLRLARRRRHRAARQEGLPRQDRLPGIRRARRIPVCLEATGHDP